MPHNSHWGSHIWTSEDHVHSSNTSMGRECTLFYWNFYFIFNVYYYIILWGGIFHLQSVLLNTEPSLQPLQFLRLKIYSSFTLDKPTSCMLAFSSKKEKVCVYLIFEVLGIKLYFCSIGYWVLFYLTLMCFNFAVLILSPLLSCIHCFTLFLQYCGFSYSSTFHLISFLQWERLNL